MNYKFFPQNGIAQTVGVTAVAGKWECGLLWAVC